MINKVTLIGHTGGMPEVRKLENGAPVANVSLATSESWKDDKGELQTQTEWHRLIFWRKQAELLEKLVTEKGVLIYIEGKITYRKYTDKDGQEKQSTDIVVDTFRLMGKKDGKKSNDDSFPTNEPKAGAKQTTLSNEPNDDIFSSGIEPINTPYKVNDIYKVKSGKHEGKELTIQSISESKVSFKFSGEMETTTWDKETFDKFYPILELSDLPF